MIANCHEAKAVVELGSMSQMELKPMFAICGQINQHQQSDILLVHH
jgi:hypothetical protein